MPFRPGRVIIADQPGRDPDERTQAALSRGRLRAFPERAPPAKRPRFRRKAPPVPKRPVGGKAGNIQHQVGHLRGGVVGYSETGLFQTAFGKGAAFGGTHRVYEDMLQTHHSFAIEYAVSNGVVLDFFACVCIINDKR